MRSDDAAARNGSHFIKCMSCSRWRARTLCGHWTVSIVHVKAISSGGLVQMTTVIRTCINSGWHHWTATNIVLASHSYSLRLCKHFFLLILKRVNAAGYLYHTTAKPLPRYCHIYRQCLIPCDKILRSACASCTWTFLHPSGHPSVFSTWG